MGRVFGTQALLDVTRHVLKHHDRVVHHKSRGNGERHQGQVVQTVVQQIHHPKGAGQGHGNGNAWNQS